MTEVAITGFTRSGKTVFLTSLYWNILYQMQEKSSGARSFSVLNDYDNIFPRDVLDNNFLSFFQNRVELNPFDIDKKIDFFKNGNWPRKTRECESFAFDLEAKRADINPLKYINKYLPKDYNLDTSYLFVDFPGERIADIDIAKTQNFEDWSVDMLAIFDGEKYAGYRELSAKYRELLHNTNTQLEEILSVYKDLLITLLREGLPIISPSSLRLNAEGVLTTKRNLEDAICGLTKESQFAPLSENWKGTQVFKEMQKHYTEYRKKLVLPLFNVVESADVLVVLFDVADILSSGYETYRATLELLDNLSKLCEPSKINPLRFWKIKKVVFVATQSDRVAKDDVLNLLSLLKELTSPLRRKLNSFGIDKVGTFYCTSCQSTNYMKAKDEIKASYKGEVIPYKVPRIPEYFPKGNWQAMDTIPFTDPPPIKGNVPPQSINLDKILKFILD